MRVYAGCGEPWQPAGLRIVRPELANEERLPSREEWEA
jgi:hypothetical protein